MPNSPDDLVMSNEDVEAALSDVTSEDGDSQQEEAAPDEMDSDEEVPSNWEDDPEAEEADAESDEEQESPRKKGQSVRQVKANGKLHEVDLSDTATVDRLLSLGLGARQVFSERDQLKKKVATVEKSIPELMKYKELWETLESKKSDHDGLYEKIFGKPFTEAAKARQKELADYEAASPEERRLMDLERKAAAREAAETAREAKIRESETKMAEREAAAERKALKAELTPSFHKYEFSTKVKDSVQAEKLNAALWRLTIADLKRYGNDWEPDSEVIDKHFKENAEMLMGTAKTVAKKEVAKITEQKKKVAKEKATAASTRNYKTTDTNSLAKEKDPVKLFYKMFGRKS